MNKDQIKGAIFGSIATILITNIINYYPATDADVVVEDTQVIQEQDEEPITLQYEVYDPNPNDEFYVR